MTRTDDECYDPGKVSPVDRAVVDIDHCGIAYWADEGKRIEFLSLRDIARKAAEMPLNRPHPAIQLRRGEHDCAS